MTIRDRLKLSGNGSNNIYCVREHLGRECVFRQKQGLTHLGLGWKLATQRASPYARISTSLRKRSVAEGIQLGRMAVRHMGLTGGLLGFWLLVRQRALSGEE